MGHAIPLDWRGFWWLGGLTGFGGAIGEGTAGFSNTAASAPPPVEMTESGLGEASGSRLPVRIPTFRDETAKGWGTHLCAWGPTICAWPTPPSTTVVAH
jgi:hypothetical protein